MKFEKPYNLIGREKFKNFPKYGVGLQQESKNYKNFHLKLFLRNSNNKIFQKPPKKPYFNPFRCKYGPRFLVGYKFLATSKKSKRQRDREMTVQTEVHISQNYYTRPRSNKTDRDNHYCWRNFSYANPGSIASNLHNFWH